MRPGVEQFVWVRQLVAKEQRADSHSHTHCGGGWDGLPETSQQRKGQTEPGRKGERGGGDKAVFHACWPSACAEYFRISPPFNRSFCLNIAL